MQSSPSRRADVTSVRDSGAVLHRKEQPTPAADSGRVAGSRPTASHAARTVSYCAVTLATGENGRLYSAAYLAASLGVRFAPHPPITIGEPPLYESCCIGFGSPGESVTDCRFPS